MFINDKQKVARAELCHSSIIQGKSKESRGAALVTVPFVGGMTELTDRYLLTDRQRFTIGDW